MSQMYIISIIQKRDDKSYFKPCGVGWANSDGSINFKLDVLGDTQLHIRKAKDEVKKNG